MEEKMHLEIAEQNRSARDSQAVRILAVDDREDNLLSIETILERDGYEIVKATSGRNALKILLKEQNFSLILMDVQMPEMNGFETASLIYEREKMKEIPVIFITAHDHGEDLLFKGYKMGGVDYIYKPLNPDLLRFKVGVFVELYKKTTQLLHQERKLLAINESLANEIEEKRNSEQQIKLLNEQLMLNNANLKAINEELDQFAYVASHDLQEPLRKIQLFNDRIHRKAPANLDPFVTDNLKRISDAAERMQNLINDLLKFSRHAQTTEDLVETNLDKIVEDIWEELENEVQKKKARLEKDVLPVLHAIPSQMEQLFRNLIGNSLKFSRKGVAPVIEVRAKMSVKPGELHEITVRDNGIGFDPRYAEDVFVVFKRLHSYHEFEGSGIGLSICKKIVDRHLGEIRAESVPGQGTTFIIRLPG
jgi:signal transduction histidine kinase